MPAMSLVSCVLAQGLHWPLSFAALAAQQPGWNAALCVIVFISVASLGLHTWKFLPHSASGLSEPMLPDQLPLHCAILG